MAPKIPFQFIMEISLKDDLARGMVLPTKLGNAIPRTATHVLLLHYPNRKFRLEVERHGNGLIKVVGKNWKLFLASAACQPPFHKICFRQIEPEYVFEVQFYDFQDLEYRVAADGESYVHSCLLNITPNTFHKQTLPYKLLLSLNGNGDREPAKDCKVIGPVKGATVEVWYDVRDFQVNGELLSGPIPVGFEGTNWVDFCIDNDFMPGRTMKVSKSKVVDGSFVIDVFKMDGACVQVGQQSVIDVLTSYDSPDSESDCDSDLAEFLHQHMLKKYEKTLNKAPVADESDDDNDYVEFLYQEAPKEQPAVGFMLRVLPKLEPDVESWINEPKAANHDGEPKNEPHVVTTSNAATVGSISNHCCRFRNHTHSIGVDSWIMVQLRPHNLRTRCLTIPKNFVRKHQIQKYFWAKVHFQTAWYPGKVIIRLDSRRPGDDTHVVLQVNWRKVVEDIGMRVGDDVKCEMRLQLNIDKCDGDVADFDICYE